MNTSSNYLRLHILDVLRGFAIVSIMLLHNIEHFDVYFFPENLPEWLKAIDGVIWDTLFFLFGGKSYAIFALLFGVTFAIQLSRQEQKGKSFRGRFAWRMLLLFGFGIINSAFFEGDILAMYAVIGLLLIPLSMLSDKFILVLAILLMMLPVEWWHLLKALKTPNAAISDPASWYYFGKMFEYIPNSSIWATFYGNLTNGKIAVLLWSWENGRFFSILALFLFGYLLSKNDLFIWTDKSKSFWIRAFLIAVAAFIPLFILGKSLNTLIVSDIVRRPVSTIESALTNFAFMVIWVAGITLIFQNEYIRKKLMYFSFFGRMSLSNYMIQSILGAAIYYGWGLGLYKYTGATIGVLIGLVLTLVMGKFCKWWSKSYKQGPFEILWHKATWIGKS